MKRRSLFLLASLVIALGAVAQNRFAGVEIQVHPVAGSVYMLEGRGGNIGLQSGDDGLVMIDSQFAPLAEKIEVALKKVGAGKLRFLLNTHHHGDHVGGNQFFAQQASIVAHENVRKRLEGGAREALPVITFTKEISLHLNGEDIDVLHLPSGHTDGDSIVIFKGSNVVHMGDLFFSGRFPFIDLDGGGDVEGYMRNVETAIGFIPADAKIIPGHGPLSTLDDLKTFHGMLQETVGVVRAGVQEGKSLEQIQAEGLDAKWNSWEWDFINRERWLRTLHTSLTR